MNRLPVWVWTISFDWMRAFIKIRILDFVCTRRKEIVKNKAPKQKDIAEKKNITQNTNIIHIGPKGSRARKKNLLKMRTTPFKPFLFHCNVRLYIFSIEIRIESNPRKNHYLTYAQWNKWTKKKNNPKTNHIHISKVDDGKKKLPRMKNQPLYVRSMVRTETAWK